MYVCVCTLTAKAGTHFTEWAEYTRSASARQKFYFCRGWDLNPQPLYRQFSVLPLSYHRSPFHFIVFILFVIMFCVSRRVAVSTA